MDQSTKITAWSLWEDNKLINYGSLKSDKNEKNPIERMRQMYFLIKEKISELHPDYVVFEGVQFQSNYNTYSQLSQMQGVIFSLLFELDIGFMFIEATAWRKFCGVQGRKRNEQKESAIQLVKELYSIEASEDICESILIGYWAINNIKEKRGL